jgi:hypothetical protein
VKWFVGGAEFAGQPPADNVRCIVASRMYVLIGTCDFSSTGIAYAMTEEEVEEMEVEWNVKQLIKVHMYVSLIYFCQVRDRMTCDCGYNIPTLVLGNDSTETPPDDLITSLVHDHFCSLERAANFNDCHKIKVPIAE